MMTPEMNTIYEFLANLFEAGDLVEIRGLRDGGADNRNEVKSGLFTNLEKAARAAYRMSYDFGCNGVYFCLNPIRPTYTPLRREINVPYHNVFSTTRDADIQHRTLLLIDFDPEREGGASTASEKEFARRVSQEVSKFLSGHGWPEPIVVDSGNGWHLLYRVEQHMNCLWPFILSALAKRFYTEGVTIDTSVSNLARISRLPGTWNRKGTSTDERPHRVAAVTYPRSIHKVRHGALRPLADALGYGSEESENIFTKKARKQSTELVIDEDGVLKLIEEFPEQLHLDKVRHVGENTYFALDPCPFSDGGHRKSRVGYGKTTMILRPDSLGFCCFSDDCREHTIGNLLRLLNEQTGRWPTMEIWRRETFIELSERWGGIDDQANIHYGSLEEDDEWTATVYETVPEPPCEKYLTVAEFEAFLRAGPPGPEPSYEFVYEGE
jgi:hypothetical protein